MSSDLPVPSESVLTAAGPTREAATVLEVQQASKCYRIYAQPHHRLLQAMFRGRRTYFRDFWALSDVSLTARRGQTLGIVGRNGSGKSTLLQIIAGTLTPTSGSVRVRGRVAALLELGAGSNPEFTGRENARLNATILGFSNDDITARLPQVIEFSVLVSRQ
jgi:lipopolysaccharide transport system ATP-binding protein